MTQRLRRRVQGRRFMIEVYIEVLPAPAVRAAELAPVVIQIAERVEEVLRPLAQQTELPVEIEMDVQIRSPRDVPTFPITWAGRSFDDEEDLTLGLEELREGTTYVGVLHDLAGRGFTCQLRPQFSRAEDEDPPPVEASTAQP